MEYLEQLEKAVMIKKNIDKEEKMVKMIKDKNIYNKKGKIKRYIIIEEEKNTIGKAEKLY